MQNYTEQYEHKGTVYSIKSVQVFFEDGKKGTLFVKGGNPDIPENLMSDTESVAVYADKRVTLECHYESVIGEKQIRQIHVYPDATIFVYDHEERHIL